MEEDKSTKCYTFNVNMMIHVFADNEDLAKEKLDKEGGYIGKRQVFLEDSVVLHPHRGLLKDSQTTEI